MKKLRFEIFKRDAFTCQYCGSKPPKVILEVDHILPKKEGGTNEPENLITSCFDCNRGKGARTLTNTIERIERNMEELAEKRLQLKEFNKFQKDVQNYNEKVVNDLCDYWYELAGQTNYPRTPQIISIKLFVKKLGDDEVREAMDIATAKIYDIYSRWKYFCGICHLKIKNKQNEN